MRKLSPAAWALAAACILASAQAFSQQNDAPLPKLKPPPNQKPPTATLLVVCDLACSWKLDGKAQGRIEAGDSATAKVGLGQHLVMAATEDGADTVEQMSEVKTSGQTVVNIKLNPVREARLKAAQSENGPAAAPLSSAHASVSSIPAGSTRVAVIAFQAAVMATQEFQRDLTGIQKKFEPQRTQLQQLNSEVDTLTKQLQTQSASLSDADRANLSRTIEGKKKQVQRLAEDAQKDYQQTIQDAFGRVAQKVNTLLQSYARQQGYTQVLDESQDQQQAPLVLYRADTADITKTIVDAYNAGSGAPSSPGPAGASKIAAIQFQTAVAQTNECQRELADLQKKFEPQKNQILQVSNEVDSLTRQLQAQSLSLSDAERAERTRTIDNKKKQAQRLAEDAQKDYQQQIQDMYSKIAQKVFDVMTGYNKQNGYTLALDTSSPATQGTAQQSLVLYAASPTDITKLASADITKAVTDAYNVKSGIPAPSSPAQNLPAQ